MVATLARVAIVCSAVFAVTWAQTAAPLPSCALPQEGNLLGVNVSALRRSNKGDNFYRVNSREYPEDEYVFNICGNIALDTSNLGYVNALRLPKGAEIDPSKGIVFGYWRTPLIHQHNISGPVFNWTRNGQSAESADVVSQLISHGSGNRTFTVVFRCGENQHTVLRNDQETNFTATVVMYSPYACGILNTPGPQQEESDTGLYALLAIPVVILLYCAIGAAYNTYKGEQGTERIPHSGCLFELPLLVRDGCVFTKEMMLAKCCNHTSFGEKLGGTWEVLTNKDDSAA